jgi:DNA-binding MarR family transcriptional regulator
MTTDDKNFSEAVTDWAAIFLQLSMADFNRHARMAGFSLIQMNVLMHLYYRGPSEVMGFTEMMQVSPAGASQMIERLTQQGLVQRSESLTDRRVRIVSLTDQGRQAVQASIAARQEWLQALAEQLSPAEKADVTRALNLLTGKAGELSIYPPARFATAPDP